MTAAGAALALAVHALGSQGCTNRSSPPPAASRPAPETDAAQGDAAAPPGPAAGDETATGFAGAAGEESSTLTLLDPGRLPRRILRYSWNPAQKEELTLDLRTFASTETGDAQPPEVALPPVRIVVAVDPLGVSAGGALRYAWRVTAADVVPQAAMPDQLASGMKAEVAAAARLSGRGETDASGMTRTLWVDPASVSKGEGTGQMVEQVRETLRNAPAPFPDQPVGPGARWQKIVTLASNDHSVTQSDTFTLDGPLADRAQSRGTLDDVFAQTAPPQMLKAPGMHPGDRARMESMLVSASAKTTFDLTRLVPQTRIESTTTMVVSGASAGTEAHRTTLVLRVEVALSGKLR